MKYCLNIKGITSLMGMLDPGEKATITPSKIEGYYDVVIEVTGSYQPVFDFDEDEIFCDNAITC